MVMWSKVLIALSSCALSAQAVREKRGTYGKIAGVHVHKDSAAAEDFIVLFKKGTTDGMIKAVCNGHCKVQGHPSRGGVPFAKVHGRELLSKLLGANQHSVELVEADVLDYIVPEIESPVQVQTASWGLGRVGVPSAAYTGSGINIFVQDTGVRSTHNDFGGRVIPTLDMTNDGGMEECTAGSSTCADDKQGHGTHCAGSAGGATFGVAPAATIRAVKTLSDQGSGARSWQMEAIDWISDSSIARPAVLSMSLGGSGADPSYTTAIGAATESGVTVVVAAGNSNADACNFSPAFALAAITVGSTDPSDDRSSFSNYGSCVQIWAPGRDIVSASSGSDTGSRSLSGTSMACPHVSGGVALLLEENPALTGSSVLMTLYDRGEIGAVADLNASDINQFLWVGAGAAPVPAPTPAPTTPPNFICNNGCDIRDNYVNDGMCDCSECEDEDAWTCNTCGGCPSSCGGWENCR